MGRRMRGTVGGTASGTTGARLSGEGILRGLAMRVGAMMREKLRKSKEAPRFAQGLGRPLALSRGAAETKTPEA